MYTNASRLSADSFHSRLAFLSAAFASSCTWRSWYVLSQATPRSITPGTRATSDCLATGKPCTTTAVVCGQLCSPNPETQPQPPSASCIEVRACRPSDTICLTSMQLADGGWGWFSGFG